MGIHFKETIGEKTLVVPTIHVPQTQNNVVIKILLEIEWIHTIFKLLMLFVRYFSTNVVTFCVLLLSCRLDTKGFFQIQKKARNVLI